MKTIKAVSLWQPWASLVIMGFKRFETRSWPMEFSEPFAIHAAKNWDANTDLWLEGVLYRPDEVSAQARRKLTELFGHDKKQWRHKLPRGKVIGICASATPFEIICEYPAHRNAIAQRHEKERTITADEFLFGDYRVGRFAIELGTVKPIVPFDCIGRQKIFSVPMPKIVRASR